MLRRVALLRRNVSENLNISMIRVTRIGEIGTNLAVPRLLVTANVTPSSPILVILIMYVLISSETSVLTIATWRNIPEDGTPQSLCRENLKSYIFCLVYPSALLSWILLIVVRRLLNHAALFLSLYIYIYLYTYIGVPLYLLVLKQAHDLYKQSRQLVPPNNFLRII
jgi:hypothetical protein